MVPCLATSKSGEADKWPAKSITDTKTQFTTEARDLTNVAKI